MRYFLTTTARKPVEAGGKSFKFEHVGSWGGSALGVLAVDDESDANSLAAACGQNLEEITFEQFDAKKKALSLTGNDSPGSRRPLQDNPLNHAVADRVGSTDRISKPNGGPNSTECLTPVTILSTKAQPPHEPILEGTGARRRW